MYIYNLDKKVIKFTLLNFFTKIHMQVHIMPLINPTKIIISLSKNKFSQNIFLPKL